MRDPHVGSYGLTAVVLVILGKYAVLSGLAGPARAWAVFAAAVVGRSLVLVSAGTAGYARPEGTGRILVEATTLRDAIGAAVFVACRRRGRWPDVGACGGCPGARAGLGAHPDWRRPGSGGVTGDTLGALVETGELLVLLTIALTDCAGLVGA